jgi:hypothetical protein
MVVLIVVAVACFSAGVYASARWLPPLAEGTVGTISFFAVCSLCGAALGLIGINIDSVARQLGERDSELETLIVTGGLLGILRDSGTVAALALIAYLLAPKARSVESSRAAPVD